MPSGRSGGVSAGRAGLHLQPPCVQQRLGVAAGLLHALEHQIAGRLVGGGLGEAAGHLPVGRIARVLLVHHGGHALEGFAHLVLGHHAVEQPVGDVLAADAQRGTVFHQAHVVDVGNLGAAHALVDPAHHVAEDALGVVVQLLLLLGLGPLRVGGDGNGQQAGQQVVALGIGTGLLQFLLHVGHVDLVVVQCVQRGSRGAGHPGGVGASPGVGDLLLQHGLHQVGHGPHALADLGLAAQAARQAHQHVAFLVGLDPGAGLHVALAHHGAGLHGGVHLIAGAVQEAGVDEGHAGRRGGNAGLQVHAGAALFVHDAQLDGVLRQAQQALHAGEELAGEGHFGRAVHLGLDDIDAALARVADAALALALQIVQRDGGGDDRVQDAFRDLAPGALRVGPQHGRVGHQVAYVAQEHERAAVQAHFAAAPGRGVDAVGVQAPRDGLAALGEGFGQRALEDAQPVGVAGHLVFGIDGGDGVFQIQDGGKRGFHDDVADARRVGLADGGVAVDLDVDVQAVVHQQDGGRVGGVAAGGVAHELGRVLQPGGAAVFQADDERAVGDVVHLCIGMRCVLQRRGLVQHPAREGDHLGAAHRVVALALLGAALFGDGVGAVERVVEAAPARVGGVEGVACVQDGHHQLRAGLDGELVVHVGGGGLHARGLRHEVADLLQEGAIARHVGDRAGVGLVPGVQFGLQAVALGQQGDVARSQIPHDGIEAGPERGGIDARAGQHAFFDELVQERGHLQAVDGGAVGHGVVGWVG